jgi:serine/threonine protein kinase
MPSFPILESPCSQRPLTLTGDAIIGTPSYMSPEQVRGGLDLDGRSDIYALGATPVQILPASTLQATTPMGVAMKHITEPVPFEAKSDLPERSIRSSKSDGQKRQRFATAKVGLRARRADRLPGLQVCRQRRTMTTLPSIKAKGSSSRQCCFRNAACLIIESLTSDGTRQTNTRRALPVRLDSGRIDRHCGGLLGIAQPAVSP